MWQLPSVQSVSVISIWYRDPFSNSDKSLIEFTPSVLEHLARYRQLSCFAKEAGGQIFWKCSEDGHRQVVTATGPRKSDRRGRYNYMPDHRTEQIEIDTQFKNGQFYLGDWHTHPQPIAKPSGADHRRSKVLHAVETEPQWNLDGDLRN